MNAPSCSLPPGHIPAQYRPNAGIALFSRTGLTMVGRRTGVAGDQAWQMPQGGIDRDETPERAALRELQEETGLAPAHVRKLAELPRWLYYRFPEEVRCRLDSPFTGQRQKWFAYRLIAAEHLIDLGEDEPEFEAWRWADLTSLAETVVPFKRDIYRRVAIEFARWMDRED